MKTLSKLGALTVYTYTVYFRLTTEVLNNCLKSVLTHWQNYKCLYVLNLYLPPKLQYCNTVVKGFCGNL
jgi:hypothetical protein